MTIIALTGTDTLRRLGELQELLQDAVGHGAVFTWAVPAEAGAAEPFWRMIAGEVAMGERRLWVALDERGRVAGSAQLRLGVREEAGDRAEVQKVIVRHALRGRGIGAALMARVEQEALAEGRRLLYFDISQGAGAAAAFYRKIGYRFVGSLPAGRDAAGEARPTAIFYKELAGKPGADREFLRGAAAG